MRLRWKWSGLIVLLVATVTIADDGLSLRQIAELRSVIQVAMQPDGDEIAYLLSVPRRPGVGDDGPAHNELHLVNGQGRSRLYIGHGSAPATLAWSADGQAITFIGKREGDPARALYQIPLRGGDARRVAQRKTDIRGYSLAPDGKRVALLAQAAEDEALKKRREQGFTQKIVEEDWRPYQLWIATLGEEDAEPRLLELDGSVQEVSWSPAGDRLAVKLAPRELIDEILMFSRIRIIDLDGRTLGTVETEGKLGAMVWSPDGHHLAVISAADLNDPREGRLTVVGRDGGAPVDLLPGLEGHVWNVAWRDARRLVFVSHEGTRTRLAEIDADGGNARDLAADQAVVWAGLNGPGNGDLALLGHSSEHPGEVYRLRRRDRTAARMTESNSWLTDVRLTRQEVVRYSARDGLEIEGILFHPLQRAEGERVPLILVVHGGPEAHYSNGWLTSYAQPAQHAAAKGYAMFFPNYRASTGRGVEFTKLNHGRPAREEFDDLVDGVDHLIEIGLVDRDRVGITGGSYGGYATAWGATYYSERFAAAVMNVGLADKIAMVGTTDIPQELYHVHYLTWPWQDWSMYTQASPIRHAHKSRTPTLILHGEADTRVDVSQSRSMYRYLKLAGQAPVRLVLYPGEGHGNVRAASRWDYSLRLMRWMDHYLKGEGGEPPPYEIDYQLEVDETSE